MRLGINCGSGQRRFESTGDVTWCNVDTQSVPPDRVPDIVADGAHLDMFNDASVDFFVLHHVLEHFGCGEAVGLIHEAHRVLRPNGSLLVFVPDLRMLADRWLHSRMNTQLYMTNLYGAYMNDEADRHRWGFDRDSLYHFLHDAAEWQEVKLFDWREVPGASICRDWWIAGMECVR